MSVVYSARALTVALVLTTALASATAIASDKTRPLKQIDIPPGDRLYHGVYPGGRSGLEDDLTPADLKIYERTVGHRVAWVYFSHNWFVDRAFPLGTAKWIRDAGAIPFIRLMLRSKPRKDHVEESVFTLDAILAGTFDEDLRAWAAEARRFRSPLIVEWGTECNGDWFPWSASWNGAGDKDAFGDPKCPDGPERFVAVYRHIVSLARSEGAANITWVFHPNSSDQPEEAWNRFEAYYPGDDVVDWIGVSAYGALGPNDETSSFREQMDRFVWRLNEITRSKPLVLLEFGCAEARNEPGRAASWAREALYDLLGRRWPRVIGFSWWNERWRNDDEPSNDTTMRVQDLPQLALELRRALTHEVKKIQTRPVIIEAPGHSGIERPGDFGIETPGDSGRKSRACPGPGA